MAYLHCVPAVDVSDTVGANMHKGAAGFSKVQHNGTITIVDLAIQPNKPLTTHRNKSAQGTTTCNRSSPGHTKAFAPSTPSARVQFQQRRTQGTEELAAASTDSRSNKTIAAPEVKKETEQLARKSGSVCRMEKVYKPTLPKYCFSASTYQNVLTDYASSGNYALSGDLSQLPPPRHTLMTRELPYVYRYKIQQGITSLNNMIPTKRLHTSDNIW